MHRALPSCLVAIILVGSQSLHAAPSRKAQRAMDQITANITGPVDFQIELPRPNKGPVISVATSGARPDASPEQNLKAFRAAAKRCQELNVSRLIVPKGRYVIKSEGKRQVELRGLTDFTFDGQGAELIFQDTDRRAMGSYLHIVDCTRVEVTNLVLDWDWASHPLASAARVIATKGEAGTGDVVEAVCHARTVLGEIRRLHGLRPEELMHVAKEMGAPYDLVRSVAETGGLPVVNFAAGGIATPADAALMMQLGVDGVFVGSGIFKSADPAKRARAIVMATTHCNEPGIIAEVSKGLGEPMLGIAARSIVEAEQLAVRGW